MNTLSNFLTCCSVELVLLPTTVRKRYFQRPRLEVKLEPCEGSYSQKKWLSPKSTESKKLYVYETCWYYKVTISNDSRYDAYYPKLSYNKILPHYSRLDILNHYLPVNAFSQVSLFGEYMILEECEEDKNTIPVGIPDSLKSLRLMLEYQNAEKIKFYSVFDVMQGSNTVSLFKPSEFAL